VSLASRNVRLLEQMTTTKVRTPSRRRLNRSHRVVAELKRLSGTQIVSSMTPRKSTQSRQMTGTGCTPVSAPSASMHQRRQSGTPSRPAFLVLCESGRLRKGDTWCFDSSMQPTTFPQTLLALETIGQKVSQSTPSNTELRILIRSFALGSVFK
jgi:hypothetical protein